MFPLLMSILQLACFGIMGSFELAASICQQQQQPNETATAATSADLASFWPMWHSYLPAGLLVVAAAAGQLPSRLTGQLQGQGLQGPWLPHLARHLVQSNLHNMAEVYDQVREAQQ
jgi:hypothetical protein